MSADPHVPDAPLLDQPPQEASDDAERQEWDKVAKDLKPVCLAPSMSGSAR